MATLATLRAAILRNLDRSGVSSTETADVTVWINQWIREVACSEHNFPFMRTETTSLDTIVGTDRYAVPETATARLKDITEIYFRAASTDPWPTTPLAEMTEIALLQTFASDSEGPPRAWAMSGNRTIRVGPVPDAIYSNCFRIHSWEFPADLSGDSDSNELTLYHSLPIEWAVTARGLAQYGESSRAERWTALADREYQRMLTAARRSEAPQRRTLRISLSANRPANGLRRWIKSALGTPYDWV